MKTLFLGLMLLAGRAGATGLLDANGGPQLPSLTVLGPSTFTGYAYISSAVFTAPHYASVVLASSTVMSGIGSGAYNNTTFACVFPSTLTFTLPYAANVEFYFYGAMGANAASYCVISQTIFLNGVNVLGGDKALQGACLANAATGPSAQYVVALGAGTYSACLATVAQSSLTSYGLSTLTNATATETFGYKGL